MFRAAARAFFAISLLCSGAAQAAWPDRTVTLIVPLVDQAPSGQKTPEGRDYLARPEPLAGRPRVLVVDDEAKIVQLVRDYLEHAGFAVVTAGDGGSALTAVQALGEGESLTDSFVAFSQDRTASQTVTAGNFTPNFTHGVAGAGEVRLDNSGMRQKSGTTYTGFLVYDAPTARLVQTGPDTTVRLTGDEVVSVTDSRVSLMPTGLLNGMKDSEVADFYAFLKTLRK